MQLDLTDHSTGQKLARNSQEKKRGEKKKKEKRKKQS